MTYIRERLIYIGFALILIVFFAISCFFGKKKKWINPALISIVLLIYTILGSLRGSTVGFDTAAYSKMYINDPIKHPNFLNYIVFRKPEFLFYGSMYIFSIMKIPEVVFRLINYTLISVCLFWVSFKKKNGILYLEMFLAMGFLAMSFTGIRQTMATAFSFAGLNELIDPNLKYKKKYTPYLFYYISVFVAIMYHQSSIIMIAVPLLFKIKIGSKWSLLPLLFLPFVPILTMGVFRYSFIEFGIEYSVSSGRVSFLFLLTILLFLIFFLTFYFPKVNKFFVDKSIIEKDFSLRITFNHLVWGIYLLLTFTVMNFVTQILTRFAMFFYVFDIYIILAFLDNLKSKKLKSIYGLSVALLFALYFIYGLNVGGVVPYVF